MEIAEFIQNVANFPDLSHPERIKHFGWHLHHHKGQETFNGASIRECYAAVHMEPPPKLAREFRRLEERKEILPSGGGFRLEHRTRQSLAEKYGEHESVITISKLLADLPLKVVNSDEQTFLAEALKCYRVQAFRAATVMAWNLGYDHLLLWISAEPKRLAAFNAGIDKRVGPKRAGTRIQGRGDFEDLTEREVLDIAASTNVIQNNLKRVLDMGLIKRNLAAHPSGIEIDRPAADEMIHSLVTNVVLKLA